MLALFDQAKPCEEEEEEIGGSYEFVGGVVTVTPAPSKGNHSTGDKQRTSKESYLWHCYKVCMFMPFFRVASCAVAKRLLFLSMAECISTPDIFCISVSSAELSWPASYILSKWDQHFRQTWTSTSSWLTSVLPLNTAHNLFPGNLARRQRRI